jgi:hypothetical protein
MDGGTGRAEIIRIARVVSGRVPELPLPAGGVDRTVSPSTQSDPGLSVRPGDPGPPPSLSAAPGLRIQLRFLTACWCGA